MDEQKEPSKADIYGAAQRLCSAKIAQDIANKALRNAEAEDETANDKYSETYSEAFKVIPDGTTVLVGKSMIVRRAINGIHVDLSPITVDEIKNEGDNNETE